jgi:acetyl-CoA decarbonylase/synthase complex subunit beta
MERLKQAKEAVEEPEIVEEVSEEPEMMGAPMAQVAYAPELSMPAGGGVKIILKNAKIYAEKVIIKKK